MMSSSLVVVGAVLFCFMAAIKVEPVEGVGEAAASTSSAEVPTEGTPTVSTSANVSI